MLNLCSRHEVQIWYITKWMPCFRLVACSTIEDGKREMYGLKGEMTMLVNCKFVDVCNNATNNVIGASAYFLVGMVKYTAHVNIGEVADVGRWWRQWVDWVGK